MAEKRYKKGDLVRFSLGGMRTVQGVIKEDRGPIGMKGRRLYLIVFPFSSDSVELTEIELPAVEFELATETEVS